MKIVTLVENTLGVPGLTAEHGLSLYIETGDTKILFDAGQSGAFADNAAALGVDLAQVDLAVLSHGHYDHSEGFGRFFEINARAPLYLSRYAQEPHRNSVGNNVGVLRELPGQRLILTEGTVELGPGIRLHTVSFAPEDTGGMMALTDGVWTPEDFRHEQYLLVEEAGKRILISGCSHKGIVGIAEHFRADVLVGGFHFMKITDEQRLEAAAQRLLALDTVYYTGHCTGEPQFAFLKTKMGDRVHYLATGCTVEL